MITTNTVLYCTVRLRRRLLPSWTYILAGEYGPNRLGRHCGAYDGVAEPKDNKTRNVDFSHKTDLQIMGGKVRGRTKHRPRPDIIHHHVSSFNIKLGHGLRSLS
jgi:hypothetical protein